MRLNGASNCRALGTLAACEIDQGDHCYLSGGAVRLLAHFRERNVLVRPLGNTIYVMPPYCIDDRDLDLVYGAVQEALDS